MYIFFFSPIVLDAGKVFVCGNNDCGQIGLRSVTSQGHLYPCDITTEEIVQIACGENHSAFITGKFYTKFKLYKKNKNETAR